MAKIAAIGMSLQAGTEEPIAHRVGAYLDALFAQHYPSHEHKFFSREAIGYVGDAFSKLRADINAYAPLTAFHIHADAYTGSNYGFSNLYCGAASLEFAEYIEASMYQELVAGKQPNPYTKDNGLSPRCDVGALNTARLNPGLVVVMGEVDFYDNIRMLPLLEQDWYCAVLAWAIFQGWRDFLRDKFGIVPAEKEEEEDVMLPSPIATKHSFPDIWMDRHGYWMHCKNETDKPIIAKFVCTKRDGTVLGIKPDVQIVKYMDYNFDLTEALVGIGVKENCSVTVETGGPSACCVTQTS